jgi:hypothetical protein
LLIACSFGAVFEVLLAWAVLPRYGWRALLMLSTIPMLLALVFAQICPESPMFLARKGRGGESMEILNRISKANGGSLHNQQWNLAAPLSGSHRNSLIDNLGALLGQLGPTTRRLWVLWFSSSFVYYGIVLISPRFFPSQGEYKDILLATISEFPGVLIPFFGIDAFGRKRTLTALYAFCAVACFSLTVQASEAVEIGVVFVARGTISAAFISLYVTTAESYPTSLRSTGFGISSSIARAAGIATSFISEDHSVSLALLLFSICSFVASLAAITLPHETANQSLPDDDVLSLASDDAGLLVSESDTSSTPFRLTPHDLRRKYSESAGK